MSLEIRHSALTPSASPGLCARIPRPSAFVPDPSSTALCLCVCQRRLLDRNSHHLQHPAPDRPAGASPQPWFARQLRTPQHLCNTSQEPSTCPTSARGTRAIASRRSRHHAETTPDPWLDRDHPAHLALARCLARQRGTKPRRTQSTTVWPCQHTSILEAASSPYSRFKPRHQTFRCKGLMAKSQQSSGACHVCLSSGA